MEQIKCPTCRKLIDNDSKFCEFCGGKIDPKKDATGDININFENRNDVLLSPEKQLAKQEITTGVIWVAIGIVITWLSYTFASEGGTYFIFWGLVIYGAYKIIKGSYNLSS
ncbi:MAG: zinc ribbon domain-containing protein [bacterium]